MQSWPEPTSQRKELGSSFVRLNNDLFACDEDKGFLDYSMDYNLPTGINRQKLPLLVICHFALSAVWLDWISRPCRSREWEVKTSSGSRKSSIRIVAERRSITWDYTTISALDHSTLGYTTVHTPSNTSKSFYRFHSLYFPLWSFHQITKLKVRNRASLMSILNSLHRF